MTEAVPGHWRGLRLRLRARQGWTRVQLAGPPVLQAAVAAAGAFAVSRYALGHQHPFFAPVAAWLALGFTSARSLRRVAELAAGVSVGVGFGDLMVHWIGSGPVQVAVVLAIAVLVGRFLDGSTLLATQAGAQAMIIVGLPAGAAGGPLGRWQDAVVGGVVAFAVAALTPGDIRAQPRELAQRALGELSHVLELAGTGLQAGDEDAGEEALVAGRASQPTLDEWRESAAAAREVARLRPGRRHLAADLARLEGAAVLADRAMRNARVIARRSLMVAREGQPGGAAVGDLLLRTAAATSSLAGDVARGTDEASVRALRELAAECDPRVLAPDDWHAQSLALLVRSLLVDLLEVAGVEADDARAALPEL